MYSDHPDLHRGKSTSTRAHYVKTEEVSNVLNELHRFALGAASI